MYVHSIDNTTRSNFSNRDDDDDEVLRKMQDFEKRYEQIQKNKENALSTRINNISAHLEKVEEK